MCPAHGGLADVPAAAGPADPPPGAGDLAVAVSPRSAARSARSDDERRSAVQTAPPDHSDDLDDRRVVAKNGSTEALTHRHYEKVRATGTAGPPREADDRPALAKPRVRAASEDASDDQSREASPTDLIDHDRLDYQGDHNFPARDDTPAADRS